MAATPDTSVVTGPVLQQVSLDAALVTPAGGVQTPLSELINGGTVAAGGLLSNFSSITPAGSNEATAPVVTGLATVLGAAASTTGVTLPLSTAVFNLAPPILVINAGTAAIKVYGQGGDTIDTTAGTTGVALTNAHRCFFTCSGSGTWVSGPEGGVTS